MTVGSRVPMLDADARVRGTIAYTSNADVAGAAVGRLVRSQQPHARIRSINSSAAAALPGVLAVLTGADLRQLPGLSPFFGPLTRDQPILAIDEVRYVGEPLAAIAAVDADTAAEAVSVMTVEYEPLPAVLDLQQSHQDAAEYTVARGDVESGFADAEVVVVADYTTPRIQHVALEPHAVLARVDGDGVVVESNTQTPHHLRRQLADIFGLPMTRVRIVVSTLGGAFGSKSYPEIEPIAVALARATRRPVKLVLDRGEEFVTTARHATRIRIESGAMRNGKIVAVRAMCVYDNGAYQETADRVIRNAARALTAAYAIPNVHVTATARHTNNVPCGPFRAPGAAQAVWAMESHIDELAAQLGLDPLELRVRNVVASGQSYVDGGLLEHIRFPEMLRQAANLRAASTERLESTERRGVGFAIGMKTTNTPSTSTAIVKMNQDGSLDVLTSSVEMGQGATTVLAQMAASRARIPLARVSVRRPDTDATPFDHATTSSRTTFAMGAAIEQAVDRVTNQLRELASQRFEVAPEDLELRDGGVGIAGSPDQSVSYGDLITDARRGNLIGHATYTTSAKPDPVTGQPGASAHYHQAVGAAEVAVDVETGRVRLLRLHAGVFVGLAINPTLCELQVEGCMAMGAGQALFEELIIDGGQIANGNLGDYLIPALSDLPARLQTGLYEESEHPDVHGIGEVAVPVVAPAIANAVADAVHVRVRDLPLTPERILRALDR
jgi:CO/xanthine dehydrogenase Mo-binding subunit